MLTLAPKWGPRLCVTSSSDKGVPVPTTPLECWSCVPSSLQCGGHSQREPANLPEQPSSLRSHPGFSPHLETFAGHKRSQFCFLVLSRPPLPKLWVVECLFLRCPKMVGAKMGSSRVCDIV